MNAMCKCFMFLFELTDAICLGEDRWLLTPLLHHLNAQGSSISNAQVYCFRVNVVDGVYFRNELYNASRLWGPGIVDSFQ